MTEADPLHPHSHDPNPVPPSSDATFTLYTPDDQAVEMTVAHLQTYTATTVPDCYIVSTGHGTSGPFAFTGVSLLHLIQHHTTDAWSQVEVISADGFGNRVMAAELNGRESTPMLLAYAIDGRLMTRQQGLVRLIVPSETDDALRQVKWVKEVRICP